MVPAMTFVFATHRLGRHSPTKCLIPISYMERQQSMATFGQPHVSMRRPNFVWVSTIVVTVFFQHIPFSNEKLSLTPSFFQNESSTLLLLVSLFRSYYCASLHSSSFLPRTIPANSATASGNHHRRCAFFTSSSWNLFQNTLSSSIYPSRLGFWSWIFPRWRNRHVTIVIGSPLR